MIINNRIALNTKNDTRFVTKSFNRNSLQTSAHKNNKASNVNDHFRTVYICCNYFKLKELQPNSNDIFDACRKGDLEKVKELYNTNPEIINQRDFKGFTPIILATYNQQSEVTDFLLEKGAEVNAPDGSDNSALMGTAFKGYTNLAKKLIDAGANVNQRNANGATALTFAATFGHIEIAKMLLEHGADIHISDVRGKSSLDHARMQENWEMYDLLLRYDSSRR